VFCSFVIISDNTILPEGMNCNDVTIDEMQLLCVLHSGTISETVETLERIDEQPAKIAAFISSAVEKLKVCLKENRPVTLMFDPED